MYNNNSKDNFLLKIHTFFVQVTPKPRTGNKGVQAHAHSLTKLND